MYKEIEVDRNLYHLLNVLLDLDSYQFDRDVIALLNQLKSLVDKKLWSGLDFEDYNIMDEKIIVRYLLEK